MNKLVRNTWIDGFIVLTELVIILLIIGVR
jgi:hypothetical protein